ncbi:hypothetical protein [Mixta calida]|uniref:hypothetical protein n=1 Tax=Mixta calida TaxID=665913 RepID=UPI0028A9F4F2|nr:hypothetical protein [Mixta calida]
MTTGDRNGDANGKGGRKDGFIPGQRRTMCAAVTAECFSEKFNMLKFNEKLNPAAWWGIA